MDWVRASHEAIARHLIPNFFVDIFYKKAHFIHYELPATNERYFRIGGMACF